MWEDAIIFFFFNIRSMYHSWDPGGDKSKHISNNKKKKKNPARNNK